MSEQKIIDAIMEEAKQEKEKVIAAAREEAERMISEAKAQAQKENAPIIEKAKNTAKEVMSKELSSADMEAKKLILMEKQSVLEEAIKSARQKLSKQSADEYKNTLSKMLSSIENAEGLTIVLSDKDKAGVSDVFTSKGFTIDSETRNINGGFIVKKGDIEYNYTFDSIFTVSKEQIEETAAKILFK